MTSDIHMIKQNQLVKEIRTAQLRHIKDKIYESLDQIRLCIEKHDVSGHYYKFHYNIVQNGIESIHEFNKNII